MLMWVIRRVEGGWCVCCLLKFPWATFQLTLSNIQAPFKFLSSLLEVSSELTFRWACFILLWTSFKLFLTSELPAASHQAFPQASFQLASSIPESSLQSYFHKPTFRSLHDAFKLPLSFFGACFRLSSNSEAQNLKNLVLWVACTDFWSSKP